MSETCNQSCSSCSQDCADRTEKQTDFTEQPHELSSIKKVIGIVSGKGGVGKSLVTSLLAVTMQRRGHSSAILDADITGPSIPKAFGIKKKAMANELGLFPIKSATGIDIMSVNLLLENDTDPVVWRGPIIANTVKQFWTDVIWNNVDFMFIDMPPGTGDVPLTVFQSVKVDGIIIVTSPQELVSMIVAKAVKMAQMMNVPIVGIVENMSSFKCPDCDKEYKIFGDSNIENIAAEYNLDILAKLPIDPRLAAACDGGLIELFSGDWFDSVAEILEKDIAENDNDIKSEGGNKVKIAVAGEKGVVTGHFGHCESFHIFEAVGDKIVSSESVANPGHKPGFLPNFLNDMGVNVIISGGMGGGAVDIFNEKGIEVIVGASGPVQSAAEQYLSGALKSTGSVCNHNHDHGDECGQ
ncbi:putative ATP-binding protein (plasmid) [Peptoclostridium acidaminophilum DSM 3953]|uniref:Iron-sulfur cluster carrier protein n=1 Tax=Peptoclostridium acidaminophilum DSM 3953 TaxID=1286171 RepID=W8TN17_PEPAC|nr:iron-sulfur cluster carrier protein MrpORP [Peptoclostridium acidaminophilum]AHM57582.1 putative ATP-binding protein [Peptoclostridium acidaminophilum DSM 3953]